MRTHLTPIRLLTVALTSLAGVGMAAAANPTMTKTTVTKTETMTKPETEQDHIDHLREIRATLNHTRKMLKEETMSADDENHKMALKSLETAIDAVNHEVVDYEKAHPNLMPEKK